MKFKFVATPRDIIIFIIFALFLLYVVALGVLNIPRLASEGMFYGLNPLEAFSPDYIGHTMVFYIVALVGLILSVNSYFFEFQEGVGLKISNSSGGGYSDWAKVKDIKTDKNVKRVLASDPKSDYAGVPLISNGHELWVDDGEYHTLVIGATGSGKTQDTILPTIKVLAKKGESVVVTDPKGEIYEKAGGLLKENGYNIILLNFRNPQNGNTWNPLELPYRLYKEGNQDKAIELLDDLALNILYDETNANSDPFWEKTAADYFSGIALAMFEDTTEDKININSINMTATVGEDKFGGSTYIKEYFNMKDPAGAAYVNASGTVMAPNETKGGIISVFKQKIKLFASRENLSEMLSYSDFKLDSIGTQKTAVFIIIQDEKKTYHSLATILIKQIYETLIDVAQAHGGKLPCRTNFLLDEFANMPPLKDVTTMITAARSRQIRFTMIIQNFAQLNKVYGKDDAETIKGNCGNIIYLISTELAALEEISKLCGEKKSKKDDKTASTPLVTVSDLQRMKQFDHIVLRMRKSPFKTSFVPDFKIDWGNCTSPKVDYPTREKRKVEIFDIREFVKEKKNQKINEMMKGMGLSSRDETDGGTNSGGRIPFPVMPPKNELSVNDLVRKIEEKLDEIEKEEQEEKKKKEQEEKRKRELETVSTNKEEKEEEKENVINNITINNYHNEEINDVKEVENKKSISEYNKNKNVELLDDDFIISNEEIEKKVNEKLKGMKEEVPIAKIEEIDDKKQEVKEKEQEHDEIKPSIKINSEELERKVNDRITDEIIMKDELERNNKRINSEVNKELQDTVNAVLNNNKRVNQVVAKQDLEEQEMIQDIENKLKDLKKDQEAYINDFKKTSTIKLDDAAKDDDFFDDFFDD